MRSGRAFHGSSNGRGYGSKILSLCIGVVLATQAAVGQAACVGDCNRDGEVTINELIVGVNIALGNVALGACSTFDRNADGEVTIDEILAAVNNTLDACPPEATPTPSPLHPATATATATVAATPLFPANYRDTYIEVRGCRFGIEHGGVNIRVLANPIAVQPYLSDANPLPVGSIVVKEEYGGQGCSDANLLRWRAMRKEMPGFDPDDGDWHWQWVEADRSVLLDDKQTCIGCHRVPDCLARDYMCTVDETPPRGRLTLVLSNQPAALLSVAGTSPSDVYAVGADPGDGFGPYILRYDGQRWRRLDSGASGDLWWVSVTPIDGAFYMAGDGGLILRYDPASDSFEQFPTPGPERLFGIWGAGAGDLWAVGGDPNNESTGGVVWHFDGVQWSVDEEAAKVIPGGLPTLYKVWGRSASDVYVVGRLGVILRFDGIRWSRLTSNSVRPLFTVHGNATELVAVGGSANGAILEQAGDTFVDVAVLGTPQVNGVFIPPDGRGVAVGNGGAVLLRDDGGWREAETGLRTPLDFHGTWVDPEGGIWAVGGDLSLALNRGMLAYSGSRTIGSAVLQPSACPVTTPVPGTPQTVSYSNDIVPLFIRTGCTASNCHGGVFPSSSYDMRSYEATFEPGTQAKQLQVCPIVPGNPDASYLLEKVRPAPRAGGPMPVAPRDLWTVEEVDLLRTWILEGAHTDAPPTVTATPTRTIPVTIGATPTRTPTSGPTPTPNAACTDPGVICTVAGTGMAQFTGDGGPAVQASLFYPLGVAFDPAGAPLIVDWNNLRVRRINPDGTIQTVMGTGFENFPTDGALATETPLHHASDIAFDSIGRLYVAGDHVPVVFRVGLDNRVFTVAGSTELGNDGDGGPARQARLTSPFGVEPDAVGGFYIADVNAHVIRYVDIDGIIHRAAGTGLSGYGGDGGPAVEARVSGPACVRLGPDGDLYFCDTNNHAVRRVDSAGVITPVAGTGVAGHSGDAGPALQARLNLPHDLRFGPDGALYIADTGNHVIRRVDNQGIITTVAGTASVAGFSGDFGAGRACELNRPYGVNFADDGSMWIADTFNHRVRRIHP